MPDFESQLRIKKIVEAMLFDLMRRWIHNPASKIKAELKLREWGRLQMILIDSDQEGLSLWLKQTARQGHHLQMNFDRAASGGKPKYCISKTLELEQEFMARSAAYSRAISDGWIDGPKIPRLYSSPMYNFIQYHLPEANLTWMR